MRGISLSPKSPIRPPSFLGKVANLSRKGSEGKNGEELSNSVDPSGCATSSDGIMNSPLRTVGVGGMSIESMIWRKNTNLVITLWDQPNLFVITEVRNIRCSLKPSITGYNRVK